MGIRGKSWRMAIYRGAAGDGFFRAPVCGPLLLFEPRQFLGVFAVWLQGFLSPRRDQPAYITLSGVHL